MRAPTLAFLLLPTALSSPLPKDYRFPPDTTDLGLQTGQIGVDNVDLSHLRVDPVTIRKRRSTALDLDPEVLESDVTRLPCQPEALDRHHAAPEHQATRPCPYKGGPAEDQKIGPEAKYIPKWKKKFEADYTWADGL
ncbi:hypothetical protein CTRI78_v007830 [Colletotrichum trifolii]|uniref:Uncharacterized protein n=1 Tax=Colletotrichum trifolii TaxID=5466 RepID=A0A4R8R3X1_COLTR|nr:hypothetical protein CTRI78_v007830 [Colletotrichum trifolii]